ncbi:MAG: 30S ribosomal protein S6 [Ignavibacteriales bacterium]|nr:30S ribosomal protein S6 [Ignavibacteriales bacterium]
MNQQSKRSYETIFIVNATLDDAQIEHLIEKLKEFLVKQGSDIQSVESWGRKRLAYSIQKKNNGFYVLCEFSAGPEIGAKLERYYALEENVIRFLIVQLTDKALRARREKAAAETETPGDEPAKPLPKTTPPAADNADGENNAA